MIKSLFFSVYQKSKAGQVSTVGVDEICLNVEKYSTAKAAMNILFRRTLFHSDGVLFAYAFYCVNVAPFWFQIWRPQTTTNEFVLVCQQHIPSSACELNRTTTVSVKVLLHLLMFVIDIYSDVCHGRRNRATWPLFIPKKHYWASFCGCILCISSLEVFQCPLTPAGLKTKLLLRPWRALQLIIKPDLGLVATRDLEVVSLHHLNLSTRAKAQSIW